MATSRENLLNELVEIGQECTEPGWDGYKSKPILKKDIRAARKFITNLADAEVVQIMSIVPCPDGDLDICVDIDTRVIVSHRNGKMQLYLYKLKRWVPANQEHM